jgi:putative redox protein
MSKVTSTVSLKWVEETLLTAFDSRGRPVVIGKSTGRGQDHLGLKASDLLLLAAASCSAYDLVTILKKQREPFSDLEVVCDGIQNSEPPYAFTSINLHYKVTGKLSVEKLQRAIQLSVDKYCSVIATLKPAVEITSDFKIVDI